MRARKSTTSEPKKQAQQTQKQQDQQQAAGADDRDAADRAVITKALSVLERTTEALIGEAAYKLNAQMRLALYVTVASRGAVGMDDVKLSMLTSLDQASRYAVDADAHAAGVRAMLGALITDHPTLLASVFSFVHGPDVLQQAEKNARIGYYAVREKMMQDAATHEAQGGVN